MSELALQGVSEFTEALTAVIIKTLRKFDLINEEKIPLEVRNITEYKGTKIYWQEVLPDDEYIKIPDLKRRIIELLHISSPTALKIIHRAIILKVLTKHVNYVKLTQRRPNEHCY